MQPVEREAPEATLKSPGKPSVDPPLYVYAWEKSHACSQVKDLWKGFSHVITLQNPTTLSILLDCCLQISGRTVDQDLIFDVRLFFGSYGILK